MGRVADRRARVTDAIVAVASEVMAQSGAAGLSLGEVARRMGMRTPSLYGYFDSRAALCDEIFRRGWVDYGRFHTTLTITPETDPVGLLRAVLLHAVTWANEHRAAAELMFWRPIPNWRPSDPAYQPAIEVLARSADILGQTQRAGLLRADADVEEMTQALAVLVAGLVSQQLSNEPGIDAGSGRASRHAASLAAMYVRHYAPGEGTTDRGRSRR